MRFRFTIRDLLWLTVVVALAVGWWLDHKPQRFVLSRIRESVGDREHTLIEDNDTGEVYELGQPLKFARD